MFSPSFIVRVEINTWELSYDEVMGTAPLLASMVISKGSASCFIIKSICGLMVLNLESVHSNME